MSSLTIISLPFAALGLICALWLLGAAVSALMCRYRGHSWLSQYLTTRSLDGRVGHWVESSCISCGLERLEPNEAPSFLTTQITSHKH